MKNEEKKELNDKEAEQVTGGVSVEETAEKKAEELAAMLAGKKTENSKVINLNIDLLDSRSIGKETKQ